MDNQQLLVDIYNALNEGQELSIAKRKDLMYRIVMANHLLAQALKLEYPLPDKITIMRGIDHLILPGKKENP